MGLLRVTGTIAVDQFWPNGTSDADTVKLMVGVEANGFEYRPHPAARFTKTDVFRDAVVKGKAGSRPIINKKGLLTIRLQGIDAPELHFRPPAPSKKDMRVTAAAHARYLELNEDYRQHVGESATVALYRLLAAVGQPTLTCTLTTEVARPTDVFDVYGRFVGDVEVKLRGRRVNLNHWLVQSGWAVPAFYNSMSADEIDGLRRAAERGRKKKGRIGKFLQRKIGRFDRKLLYRKKVDRFTLGEDQGPLIAPKLFRRLCTWSIYTLSGLPVDDKFKQYLSTKSNTCYTIEDFLTWGAYAATPYTLGDFLLPNGTFQRAPDELVYKEEPSRLVDTQGREIVAW